MTEKRKLWGKIKLLHPKNLAKEVDVYGYHFSWKSHTALMIGALTGIGVVGFMFQLKPLLLSILIGAVGLALPVMVLDMYKRMYEQKRFADAAAYMEQMLYSFQKTQKVLSALYECREIFPEGLMCQTIERAIAHIEQGKASTKSGIIRESLQIIEKQYDCLKLHMVHELLVGAEEYGGETENSVFLLLTDIENWKKRGYRLQAEKKKSHTDNVISIIVSVLLCAAAICILEEMKSMFGAKTTLSMFQIPVIQGSSVLFLLFLLFVFVKSAKNLTNDWLTETDVWSEEYLGKSYRLIQNYSETAEKRKSFLMAVPTALASGILFGIGKNAFGVGLLTVTIVLLMQHKIGYAIAKKDVTEALYQILPQWLTEMALLLQNNNVQVSLMKSMETSTGILRWELENLLASLAEHPGKISSYTSFCEGYDIPEATSCMKMLHAVSETGTGNVGAQMGNLLERVHEMQNRADDIRNEKTAFQMKLIFSYPVCAATVKLLIDLTIGMLVMFQILGNMGGM